MSAPPPGSPPRPPAQRRLYPILKRALDVVVAGTALLVLSPLLGLLALLVKATSRGPVLFHQARAGLHRKPFIMFKFRSMREDAELRHRELERLNEMDGPLFKIRKDPRITRLGRLLRRSSLDELPQLLNVLRGEMSLVGPRPLPLAQAERLDPEHQRRHDVRPGLTGLWQVSGRNFLPGNEMLDLDLQYVDRCSLWLDLRILLATIPAVLTGRGAF